MENKNVEGVLANVVLMLPAMFLFQGKTNQWGHKSMGSDSIDFI